MLDNDIVGDVGKMINIYNKKRNLGFLNKTNRNDLIIGIHAEDEDLNRIKLFNVGDSIIPSPVFGKNCDINANGYEYIDKNKPKENRYVCTIWTYPFGNMYASKVPIDQYRYCYPKVFVEPTEIEMQLVKNKDGALFIVAVFNRIVNDDLLLTAINMFVEVFDRCSIFENDLVVADKRVRFNWEILPPGERPSIHIIKILRDKKQDTDTFDVERLRTLEKYKAEIIGEGINGFYGYYAFVFNNICILESAFYGNATYIIPKENWEILSQKTKQELFNNNLLLSKIIHNESWQSRLRVEFRKFEP